MSAEEDSALEDAIAQLNATNPFHTEEEQDEAHAAGHYGHSDSDTDSDSGSKSSSSSDSEEDMEATAQALQALVLREESPEASASLSRSKAVPDADTDELFDTLASTRESDEARMARYAELREQRARKLAEREELMAFACKKRASGSMKKTAHKKDTFDAYLDEITSSAPSPRPRSASTIRPSGARASAQQDLQGEQKKMNLVAHAMLFAQ